ncbi:MAG: PIN domain-containing protein [Lachnospiraceae bacterium]|nr:PIN domain-containing protein [Lachnospiraceae bacterium]
MRVLIDTCVIIDTLQNREPFCKNSQNVFLSAANNLFSGYISAKAVTDIYYLMHRHTHDDKTSRNILNKLLALFDVLDTAGIDCRRAIPSPVSDFEDAVMIETALRAELDCIVTRNLTDFQKSPVPVYSPAEFLKKLQEES